ncbi:MAG: hypothetical protein U9Q77_10780 [Candidatus Marinimicrobia bacterium]|nr:hypothetical protein [Candidatus Neomarinimicrobiota bacterium]
MHQLARYGKKDGSMTPDQKNEKRAGYCPVYDIECPGGSEAVAACELRFEGDYNPLTSFRDADIEHCAIYRKEQQEQAETIKIDNIEDGK